MLFSYSPVCPPHRICDCIFSCYAHKWINSRLLRLVIEVSYWMCRFNRLNYCTLMGEENLEVFRFTFSLFPISLLLSLNFLRNGSEGVSVTAQQPRCCSILAVLQSTQFRFCPALQRGLPSSKSPLGCIRSWRHFLSTGAYPEIF